MKRIGDKPLTPSERSKRWREKYPEKVKEAERKRYYSDPEKARERVRQYRINNPEKIKAYNHKYLHSEHGKLVHRLATRRYKARKKRAEGDFTIEDVQDQYRRQKGKCYYCHKKVYKTYHIDHVVPLDRGGSNGRNNIVVCCPTCNVKKHNKLPHEWAEGGRLL